MSMACHMNRAGALAFCVGMEEPTNVLCQLCHECLAEGLNLNERLPLRSHISSEFCMADLRLPASPVITVLESLLISLS